MRRVLTTLLPFAVLAGGVLLRGSVHSQEPVSLPVQRPAAGEEVVDETALRYYAATGQAARRDAEARRLQWLHPGWRVPDDLGAEEAGREDEAPLWKLFAADRLDELDKAIEARRKAEPGWHPSAALQRKLARKRQRVDIVAAGKAGDWRQVIASADGATDLDIDLLWALAEARIRLGQEEEAASVLREALKRAHTTQERLVTMRKALSALPFPLAEPLLALGPTDATGQPEFAVLADDITRARIVARLKGRAPGEITPASLEAFGQKARESNDPLDLALMGWLALDERRLPDALEWFRLSMTAKPDPVTAHGIALAFERQGRLREAEDVAYAWRNNSPPNAQLYLEILARDLTAEQLRPIDPERLARYARTTREFEYADAAQALGWYAYRSCQFASAAGWFKLAMQWQPRESTAKGYALTLMAQGKRDEAAVVANRYDGLFPVVVGLAFDFNDGDRRKICPGIRDPAPLRTVNGAGLQAKVVLAFPVAVTPENDVGRSGTGAPKAPLTARRVPGVGAMPYERLGFALLPGWNGVRGPTLPAVADRAPPAGTIAASEQRALPAQTYRSAAVAPDPFAYTPNPTRTLRP
ncbi:MAG: hypothetical protein U1E62_12365 [Alsobacter sp.]